MLNIASQSDYLKKVSRSFALTIPSLDEKLSDCIANAYLLCRIADTVEDDPELSAEKKIAWLNDFASLARAHFRDKDLLFSLKERVYDLEHSAKKDEYQLLLDMHEVIDRTLSYDDEYIAIISKGVSILSYGMACHLSTTSVQNLNELDSYCYSVAGVVGELLAYIFALAERMDENLKNRLVLMSVSFGQGLQLTNILKDRSEDRKRNVSFLPELHDNEIKSIHEYIAITVGHLYDAIDFITLLPKDNSGSRMFCLVNVLMALMTVNKIRKDPLGEQSSLKVSRRNVMLIYMLCKIFNKNNFMLRVLAYTVSLGLKVTRRDYSELYNRVSMWDKKLNID